MLPTLSRLSVSHRPGSRLRHRCSSGYLRISPLHPEFRFPLRDSSRIVSRALPGLSPGLSHPTYPTAYTRFTPSNSEQRLHPLSYRGCWHRVSRCLFLEYRHFFLLREKKFTTHGPSSFTQRRSVRLSSIAENSPLLPPVGVWAVSQSQCGCPSSQTSY